MGAKEHPVVNCPVCGRAWWPRSIVTAMGRGVRAGFGFVATGKRGAPGWKATRPLQPHEAIWLYQFVKVRLIAAIRLWRSLSWLHDAEIMLAGTETHVAREAKVQATRQTFAWEAVPQTHAAARPTNPVARNVSSETQPFRPPW